MATSEAARLGKRWGAYFAADETGVQLMNAANRTAQLFAVGWTRR
jgi:hypothetical protein